MHSIITAVLTVALLLAATAPPAASRFCPCLDSWKYDLTVEEWCLIRRPTPRNCRGGLTTDECGCCKVCAKVENEKCMGPWGKEHGKCDKGLYCVRQIKGWNTQPGRCRRIKPRKENELCGGLWNGEGDCAEGLTCTYKTLSEALPGNCIR